jgi:monoamine oxidase
MKTASPEIVIIGAGLTGLTLAFLLRQSGYPATILEARNRVGGRIHTQQTPSGTKVEMGATWLGSKHQHLGQLLSELDLGTFAQFLGTHAI